jgi:tetrahydromethanopterin S-methyltransferase subunit C
MVAVLLLRRLLPQAPTYLRWPKATRYWRLAAVMGLAFAAIMLVADFWPQLFRHRPFPDLGYEMTSIGVVPLAAVIVALLFAAAHYQSFFHDPLAMAIAQALYAAAFAVLYAWLMERANSVAAPMLTHGLSDAAEGAATMALITWGR